MNNPEQFSHSHTDSKSHNIYSGIPVMGDSLENHSQAQRVALMYIKDSIASSSEKQAIEVLAGQTGVFTAEHTDNLPGLLAVRFNPKQTQGTHILRALPELDYARTCIALMYFKGGAGVDFETHMLRAVTFHSGVIAAERSAHKAYVLMVYFDPRHTTGSQIIRELYKQDCMARLVGC